MACVLPSNATRAGMEQSLEGRQSGGVHSSGSTSRELDMKIRSSGQDRACIAAVALLLALSPAGLCAQSASPGSMGPVSRASIAISLSVAPHMQAERVPASEGLRSSRDGTTQPFCVWSNGSVGTFSVSATIAGSDDEAKDSSAGAYELEWRDRADRRPLRAGATLAGLTAQSPGACDPGSGSAAALVARTVARPGSSAPYTGPLLLLIAPD